MLDKLQNLRWLIATLVIVCLDQISKLLMSISFSVGQTKEITSFFNLVLAHNDGVAFSFFSHSAGELRWLFAGFAIGVVIVMLIWLLFLEVSERLVPFALSIVMGGAIGNAIGRLLSGYVIDFLDFHIGNLHWPAFNVADMAICVGVILLLIHFWKR
jgi:signal peptidase II